MKFAGRVEAIWMGRVAGGSFLVAVSTVALLARLSPEPPAPPPVVATPTPSPKLLHAPLVPRFLPGVKGYTVCGIQLGLGESQVRQCLGAPIRQGPRSTGGRTTGRAGWYLDYETDCSSDKGWVKGHRAAHIGLDRQGGKVVWVQGPTLEVNGRVRLVSTSSYQKIAAVLGKSDGGFSDDACYLSYHYQQGRQKRSMHVRGCDATDNLNTFILE